MFKRLVSMLVFMLTASSLVAQPEGRVRKSPLVLHIVVDGDLCTARAGREISARIGDAADGKFDAVVLDVAGDGWRPDVVHGVARAIRESAAPVTVWLRDTKRHCVGAGQAMLGLIAADCWIEGDTRVETGEDRRELAPKGTDHEKLVEELMRWAGERRGGRDSDPLLPRLLMGASAPMWAIEGELGALRLTPTQPRQGERSVVALTQESGSTLTIVLTPQAAVGLGLASGRATYLSDMPRFRGVHLRTSRTSVRVRVEPIIQRVSASVEALDRELEAIEADLRRKPRDQRVNTGPFYRELGEAALTQTARARGHLDACERLVADDPEIGRTPPPGASRTVEINAHAGAWRRAFEKRRGTIERLEKKAKEFTDR